MKNVLFVPSWLPSCGKKANGIFSLLQINAIANTSSGYSPILLDWGQGEEYLPFNNIFSLPQWFKKRIRRSIGFDVNSFGVRTLWMQPPILWTHQLPFGGHERLIRHAFRKLCDLKKSDNLQIDLIHAHVSYPGGFVAQGLSKCLGVPYVLTEFMGPFPFGHFAKSRRRLEKLIYSPIRHAAQNLVLSQYLHDTYLKLGLPQPLIVPFSVDEEKFEPKASTGLLGDFSKSSQATVRFIFVGSVVKAKGVGDLLAAAGILKLRGYNFVLDIVGEGQQLSFYRDLADTLMISQEIIWHGHVANEQLPVLLKGADVFVMPSWLDTFGVVYIEAMACGLPIIATRCGGPDSIVTSEIGQLVPVRSPALLADAMEDLINHLPLYDSMAIRAHFLENYSNAVVVKQLETVYDSVLHA